MKTLIKSPFLFFLLLTITSCSKDVTIENSEKSGVLKGTWNVEKYDYEGQTSSIFQNDLTQIDFRGFGWNMDITMTFKDNPKDYSLQGTYFVDHFITGSDGIEIPYFGDLSTDQSGTWRRTGHEVNIVIDGENRRSYISELTSDRLIISINSNSTESEEDGTTVTRTVTETYELKRISN